jgi:anti-anti-sigma regulatory factor
VKSSFQDYEHVRVVTLSGEFTTEDADQFRRAVEDRAGEAWLRLQESLGSKGGQLRLVSPDGTILKILELTRLAPAFESHPSVEAAVRSLR